MAPPGDRVWYLHPATLSPKRRACTDVSDQIERLRPLGEVLEQHLWSWLTRTLLGPNDSALSVLIRKLEGQTDIEKTVNDNE